MKLFSQNMFVPPPILRCKPWLFTTVEIWLSRLWQFIFFGRYIPKKKIKKDMVFMNFKTHFCFEPSSRKFLGIFQVPCLISINVIVAGIRPISCASPIQGHRAAGRNLGPQSHEKDTPPLLLFLGGKVALAGSPWQSFTYSTSQHFSGENSSSSMVRKLVTRRPHWFRQFFWEGRTVIFTSQKKSQWMNEQYFLNFQLFKLFL